MKLGKTVSKQLQATLMLWAWLGACLLALIPSAANAQYGEILYSPNQPTSTLRSPLIPGAPNGLPGQAAYSGMPPALGDGSMPAPHIGGDYTPFAPPSGYADQTHGNIFPAQSGRGGNGPWMYVPGAGRRGTQNGQDQGVYDYGQEIQGTQWGPGGKSGGSATQNNGGPFGNAQGMGNGGESGGTQWGPGGKNGGSATQNQGGTFAGAQGMGNGGESGGTQWGPGGKNGGSATQNHGGTFADAQGMSGGGQNNGTQWGPGGKNGGNAIENNGGAAGNAEQIGNGGEMDGKFVVNNGGPRGDAERNGDRMFQHAQQPSRYDFKGEYVPTVRAFARYLVILGVVFSTVFVAMAAWSMVFGSPYGASRVIGAVGGLLMLLAGFTIWKIVEMNTQHANSTGWESHHRDGSPQHLHNGPHSLYNPQAGPFAPPQDPSTAGNNGGGNNGGGNNGGGNNGGGNNGGGNNGGANNGGNNSGANNGGNNNGGGGLDSLLR